MLTHKASNQLTIKELLLKEIDQLPDALLEELLDFVLFVKMRHKQTKSTAASLLKYTGTWQGDDLEDCLKLVQETRGQFYVADSAIEDEGI